MWIYFEQKKMLQFFYYSKYHYIFTVDIRRDTSRFGLCRVGAPRSRSDTNRQNQAKPSETMFQRVLLDFVLTFGLGAENEARTRDPIIDKKMSMI